MFSLTELLARHGCILLLDAASATVQIGLLRRDSAPIWQQTETDAGSGLFRLTEACLTQAGLSLGQIPAFAYCAGPGSMLGVRTVAMTLRTWTELQHRPIYEFHSLTLLAHALAGGGATAPFAVIADARRDTWHVVEAAVNGVQPGIRRVSSAELAAKSLPLWQSPAFRTWSHAPRTTHPCDYVLSALFGNQASVPLFRSADSPDAFQHEAPEYRRWSAQVHSADSMPHP